MASIGSDPNGLKRILFVGKDGKRRTIRLGKASMKQAEAVKVKVESLVTAALLTGSMDDETARWIAELADDMHGKLAAVGLIQPRQSMKLGAFLDAYVEGRADVKSGTATVYGHTKRCLLAFFDKDRDLRTITPADADAFRVNLATTEGLADNTVRRRMGIAKQFFRAAVRKKLLAENPFDGQSTMVRQNPKRFYFVSQQDAQAVLAAIPSAQWRLAFALIRYAGMRCPSEVTRLTWQDVNWEKSRFTVYASKTEHHDGGGVRVVPIFPELYPYLMEAFTQAEPCSMYCCPQFVNAAQMYRKAIVAAIRKAGLAPWPKLFVNLRSTRETELCKTYPIHAVTKWLGNSPNIALRHYLQVQESDYEAAARGGTESGTVKSGKAGTDTGTANSAASCSMRENMQNSPETKGDSNMLQDTTSCRKSLGDKPLGRIGLEPMTSCVSKAQPSWPERAFSSVFRSFYNASRAPSHGTSLDVPPRLYIALAEGFSVLRRNLFPHGQGIFTSVNSSVTRQSLPVGPPAHRSSPSLRWQRVTVPTRGN